MKHIVLIITALGLLAFVPSAIAQEETPVPQPDECPEIVQTAIDLTQRNCESLGPNEVCYGHLELDAAPQPGIRDFQFDLPGDIVSAITINSLNLSAMDTLTGRWGIVSMDLAADSRSATPEQRAQIILFGDVELTEATNFIEVTANDVVNVRQTPSTQADVIQTLTANQSVIANGRLADSSWIRVLLTSEDNRLGWVSADVITTERDLEILSEIPLEVAEANVYDERATYGPLQAFYFQSGTDDAPCAEAPNSGIMIQTPEGVASVSIWMDEVVVQMDDTVFLQAEPDGNLTVNVLAGTAQIEARGETSVALEGMAVDVPLDEDLGASDVPGDARALDPDDVAALPVTLLDTPVTIPPPRPVQPGVPIQGQWSFTWGVSELTCPDGTEVPFASTGGSSALEIQADTITWSNRTYTLVTSGVYSSTYADGNGNLHQDTLQVISPDFIQGEKSLDLVQPVCTLSVPFSLTLTGG